jgi:deoxycytidylate deaminase
MSRRLQDLILQGKELAAESVVKYRHSCLILRGKRVVAYGINNHRSYCNGELYSAIHAEHDAILRFQRTVIKEKNPIKAKRKTKKYTIVSVRFCSDHRISGDSKPCIECASLIKQWGFKKIVYIDKEENIIQTHSHNIESDRLSLPQKCVRDLRCKSPKN